MIWKSLLIVTSAAVCLGLSGCGGDGGGDGAEGPRGGERRPPAEEPLVAPGPGDGLAPGGGENRQPNGN